MRIYDWLVRLAPMSAADLRDEAARQTFLDVCRSSRAKGTMAYVSETSQELLNIAGVIVSAYFSFFISFFDSKTRAPKFRFSGVGRDLKIAAKSLRAGRAATVIALVTLALGIGINAAIFSVIDAVIFTEVPFRDRDRLVEITNFEPGQKMSYPGIARQAIAQWKKQADLFDRVEAYETMSMIYENRGSAQMVAGAAVTPALFDLLGVTPAVGRRFAAGDGEAGGPLSAIVSDAFWRRELGASADLSTAHVHVDGVSYPVVGVMPRSFRFPTGHEEVWLPIDPQNPAVGISAGATMTPFARLAKGVSLESANREAKARGSRVNHDAGWTEQLTASIWQPGRGADEKTTRSLWILSGAVGFLFLIVCANVANLALTRTLAKTRDLATCAALGASPSDLLRAALLENALLAGAATLLGGLIAAGAIEIAIVTLPDSMIAETMNAIDLDARALGFMSAAGAFATLLFGLPPALIASRGALAGVLSGGSRTTCGSRSARRLRSALVVAEVAVSAVLLIGGAMMTRSFVRLASVDQGFEPHNLVRVRLGLPGAGYTDAARRDQAAQQVAAAASTLPFVSSVTVGALPGERGMINVGPLEFAADPNRKTARVIVPIHEVDPNYFSTIGMKIVDGRAFEASDPPGAMVVSQRFSAKYFDGHAVGQRFRFEGKPWRYVVGVAADTALSESIRENQLVLYYPTGSSPGAFVMSRSASKIADFRTVLVRTSRPEEFLKSLPAAVSGVDQSIVIWKTDLVESVLAGEISRPRVVFVLLAVFAVFGLLLAMAGLYGVLSCLVAQRRQELGVRLALGASASGVRRLVLGNGLSLCGIGVVVGVSLAIPLVRLMKSILYEVDASDPTALAGASALLLVTAAFACWWPARDAAKTDPTVLLRRG